MQLEQLSVFLENRAGGLAEVVQLIADAGVNIRASSVADMADFGILRLVVDEPERARQALREAGFTAGKTPVVAVAVPDRPGGLAHVLSALKEHDLNVEYMYAVVRRNAGDAVLVFRFEDTDRALAALRGAGIRTLSAEDLGQHAG
jgi:hypothetical protein